MGGETHYESGYQDFNGCSGNIPRLDYLIGMLQFKG